MNFKNLTEEQKNWLLFLYACGVNYNSAIETLNSYESNEEKTKHIIEPWRQKGEIRYYDFGIMIISSAPREELKERYSEERISFGLYCYRLKNKPDFHSFEEFEKFYIQLEKTYVCKVRAYATKSEKENCINYTLCIDFDNNTFIFTNEKNN